MSKPRKASTRKYRKSENVRRVKVDVNSDFNQKEISLPKQCTAEISSLKEITNIGMTTNVSKYSLGGSACNIDMELSFAIGNEKHSLVPSDYITLEAKPMKDIMFTKMSNASAMADENFATEISFTQIITLLENLIDSLETFIKCRRESQENGHIEMDNKRLLRRNKSLSTKYNSAYSNKGKKYSEEFSSSDESFIEDFGMGLEETTKVKNLAIFLTNTCNVAKLSLGMVNAAHKKWVNRDKLETSEIIKASDYTRDFLDELRYTITEYIRLFNPVTPGNFLETIFYKAVEMNELAKAININLQNSIQSERRMNYETMYTSCIN